LSQSVSADRTKEACFSPGRGSTYEPGDWQEAKPRNELGQGAVGTVLIRGNGTRAIADCDALRSHPSVSLAQAIADLAKKGRSA